MQEQSNTALYVYGIVIKENQPNEIFIGFGLEGNHVFLLSEGKLKAIVHKCKAKPYAPKDPEKIKELVVAHNNILEKAIESFGAALPFSFNTIIQEKDGKSAAQNLKDWLKKEEKNLEQSWEKVKGVKEYGLRFFYDRKKWIEEIKAQTISPGGKSSGINYLLKGKQDYEIKNKIINKINEKKQEIFDKIKNKVQEIKNVEPKTELMEEKRDLLLCVSVLANGQQFGEVKQFLWKSMDNEDYRCAGPFPPYSFVSGV